MKPGDCRSAIGDRTQNGTAENPPQGTNNKAETVLFETVTRQSGRRSGKMCIFHKIHAIFCEGNEAEGAESTWERVGIDKCI